MHSLLVGCCSLARSLIRSLAGGEKCGKGTRRQAGRGNEKYRLMDRRAEISVGARWQKGRRHGEEGSGEQGYTFLWVQNTLSFNKGTYLPLCVI